MIAKLALGSFASAALSITAVPAQANETTTATQITGAINPDAAGGATGDAEFQELFASWKDMDTNGQLAATPRARIMVPAGMPVQGVALTSDYGMRNHPILRKRRQHNGVDLAGPSGTPVYATADGMVSRASRFGSYGNYIQIEHGGELETRYAHLSGYEVSAGDRVHKGQLIGYVGSTGRSTGPHLHYEVRLAGEPVDPRPYMVTQLALDESAGGKGGGDE
ncbi:murein DD-endopeptidase MepM/ murein hydrolase activator NlpD [Altererythrobacter atlanticus]|uniref:Murein DD-endopeptidase MepM n=1 Tax=Croceibacterium atlanticum TaxID=1267766 RepID=A0A0F7KV98_9SPHN|nr:M23 family metallopeptidase [Croceibacterium atlanticum]AKH43157.1 Murein DD-endopeptidase MepM [Croceibacterium atlanticum]MBB5732138.1 murein DD-endopeptidase MepM/ murein hydrolase activator NlpD [Croceibacterium atlanticum]